MTNQRLHIQVFGQLSEILGSTGVDIPFFADTNELRKWLLTEYPALDKLPFLIAVDKKVSQTNTPLNENAVIALLPPFSGG
jgi:molybdopterin synthase sulfur carrier subunit